MFVRSQQITSPLVLPLIGSIAATGVVASLLCLPPIRPSLSLQQLLLRVALDLAIAACIHLVTVWSIWRLIREYVQPRVQTLALHIWAAVVWVPLVVTLNAERSLWVSCIVPWAFANATTFLNLWNEPSQEDEPVLKGTPVFLLLPAFPPLPPLWKTLVPYCAVILIVQAGIASLATGHPWSAAALLSASVILFLIRYPLIQATSRTRRRFSTFSLLQTAAAFCLISTSLTPYLQKAYGLRSLTSLLAMRPPLTQGVSKAILSSDYSGIILTLPAKPHPRIVPPSPSRRVDFSAALPKPVTIPFDGAYWYFKQPDTRPKPDALQERGDPIKANIRSTDQRQLQMEAHQKLPDSILADCCHAIRLDLLNGDNRVGTIRVELLLRDTSAKPATSILLGSLPVASSQDRYIPLDRPPVQETLRFAIPAGAKGRHFDEITVLFKPSSFRARAGCQIAIQSFVLMP